MGTITNNGTITFATNGVLFLAATTTLGGSGTVTLPNNGSSIRAATTGLTLTNASTINGGSGNGIGVLGSALIVTNQSTGLIDANISGANLALAPAAGSTNAGTLRASNGGTLTIQGGGSFTNTGTVTAQDASTLNLNGITITGGAGNSFTTAGTGVILGTSVTLDGTTSAIVNSGSFQVGSTTIKGGLTNNGTVNFGTNNVLSLSDNTTITGSGTITLPSNGCSIRAATTGLTLTNSSTINGGSVNGIGALGSALVIANQSTGLFDANVASASLTLEPATGSTNAGTMQASNGGTLTIQSGAITNTGTITAVGTGSTPVSTVSLSSITLTGGTNGQLTTTSNGVITASGVLFDGSTSPVVNAGTLSIGGVTTQGTLTNNGAISFATNATLSLGADTTLNGSGTFTLPSNGSSIRANSDGLTLTNSSTINGGSINGVGVLGSKLALVNQATGLIDANISGATLRIEADAGLTNAGTLRASSGGILTFQGSGTFSSTGTIAALDASTVNLNSGTLAGGSLSTAGTGVIQANGMTFDGSTTAVVNGGNLACSNTTTVKGTLTNNGAISFATNATLSLGTDTTLNGSGTLTLPSNGSSIRATADGQTLTNSSTINGGSGNGVGVLGSNLAINNQATGLIDANISGATLIIQANAGLTNAGTLRASNGGILAFQGSGTFSSTGTIAALNASTVNLNSGTLAGGSLSTVGTGIIQASGMTFDGSTTAVVNGGNLVCSNTTTVKGTITNNGAISFTTNAVLSLGADTTLNGSGTFTLPSNGSSIRATADGQTLTNASTINGGSINGVGVLGSKLAIVNQATGLIDANISGATLTIEADAGLTNAGTLQAENGGTLTFQGTGTFSSTGTITALTGSAVDLNGGTITGGSLTTAGTGVINGSSVTLDGTSATVTNGGNFVVVNTTTLKGAIANNGTVTFDTNATLSLGANTTLSGSGTITLGNNGSSIRAAAGGLTLTNGSTINGGGNIGVNGSDLAVANQGTGLIDANASGQTLTLQANLGLTNAGTLRASNSGTLSVVVANGGTFDNTGGTVRAQSGGTVSLLSANLSNLVGNTLTGGTYQAAGTGSVIQLANNANVTQLNASVVLDGAGIITDQSGNDAFRNLTGVGSTGGSFALINGHNQTAGGAFTNAGTVQVSNSTTFTVPTSYTQTGGVTQVSDPGSLIIAPTAAINGGTLKGDGAITANVTVGAATIAPGDSPGTLTINGTLGLGNSSIFQAEIGGTTQGMQYDFLDDNGATTLGGALQVLLVSSFVPTNSETFTILEDTGALAGAFSNVANGGTVAITGSNGSFEVNYGPGSSFPSNEVVLSNFNAVPEPGSLALVGATAAGWAALRQRRRVRCGHHRGGMGRINELDRGPS